MNFPLITDPYFYAVAVPAVLLMGISKSGFGAGFGSLAVPLMALAVTVPQAAAITALGLHALQHRGQEATGVVASDGETFHVVKGIGLVSDVYRSADLEHIPGLLAIGHNRYSTAGGLTLENTQPLRVV